MNFMAMIRIFELVRKIKVQIMAYYFHSEKKDDKNSDLSEVFTFAYFLPFI